MKIKCEQVLKQTTYRLTENDKFIGALYHTHGKNVKENWALFDGSEYEKFSTRARAMKNLRGKIL